VVSLRVTSLQNVAGGTRVTFSAIAQSPVGSAIREFIWTPGDGSRPARTTTGSFSHIYPARGTEFIVWLQVNDALGASTLIARDLNLPRGPTQNGGVKPLWADHLLKETHDCGCEEMMVLVPDPKTKPPPRTGVYCLGDKERLPVAPDCKFIKNPGPPNECPEKTRAYQCGLGQFSPEPGVMPLLGWRFEVVAKLSEHTNDPSKCQQGQYARLSGMANGKETKNPRTDKEPPAGKVTLPDGTVDPKGFTFTAIKPNQPLPPFKGPDYGADDYAHPRFDKRHLPGEFRWVDLPNIRLSRAESLTQEAEFIDFLRGNLGTCWCRFSTKEDWAKDGGVKLKLIDQFHCSVKQP
jgi:hypothetical protein